MRKAWAREAFTRFCSAAGVSKTSGALPPASVWPAGIVQFLGAGGQERRLLVSVPPPASARPASRALGGHRAGRVSAGVRVADGASAGMRGPWA